MARVYVGIGSNVDRDFHILSGINALRERFGKLELSTVYESPAVGFDGDDFYNLVAGFRAEMSAQDLSTVLREIEVSFGRPENPPRYSPRTLDIDILLYDELVLDDGNLRLPREDIRKYAFVLKPLAELAGELRHPETGQTIAEMWRELENEGQPLRVATLAIDTD